MEKLSHSEARDKVEKWFKKQCYELISKEKSIDNSNYRVDLIFKNNYGYAICDVKCTESDFKNAEGQINDAYRVLQNRPGLNYVKKYIAITRDLYEVFEKKGKLHQIKSMRQDDIKLLKVYRTKIVPISDD